MFFFRKKKICPFCNKPMKEFKNSWKCDPCEGLEETRKKWYIKTGRKFRETIVRSNFICHKPRPLNECIQHLKNAVYDLFTCKKIK